MYSLKKNEGNCNSKYYFKISKKKTLKKWKQTEKGKKKNDYE